MLMKRGGREKMLYKMKLSLGNRKLINEKARINVSSMYTGGLAERTIYLISQELRDSPENIHLSPTPQPTQPHLRTPETCGALFPPRAPGGPIVRAQ